jgi:hypothetical protein
MTGNVFRHTETQTAERLAPVTRAFTLRASSHDRYRSRNSTGSEIK